MDDPVQPSGQGGESGDSPWKDYLDRIPEEGRAVAEEAFRDWDAKTTQRFQEAAEYKKQWEPLESLGVNQRDPAELEWAMQFVDALQDPNAIQTWFNDYAKDNGLTPAQQEQLEQQYVDPDIQQLQQQLGTTSQQMAEFAEWREQQEIARAQDAAMSQIRTELDELKTKHPDEYDEERINSLLPQYIESDPTHAVQRAFADWQAIVSQVQKATLQGKVDTPPGAESGGSINGDPEPAPKGQALAFASQRLREQLRGARNM